MEITLSHIKISRMRVRIDLVLKSLILASGLFLSHWPFNCTIVHASPFKSLMLSFSGTEPIDEVIPRVTAALEAVKPTGRLVVIANNSKLASEIKEHAKLAAKDRLLIISNTSYEGIPRSIWVRDEGISWAKTMAGKYRLYGDTSGASSVGNFLAACSNGEIETSHSEEAPGQGGDLISDGAGMCMGEAFFEETAKKEFGCSMFVPKPNLEIIGHENSHTDIGAAFIAPGVALVSAIPNGCKGEIAESARAFFSAQAQSLVKAGAKVFRIPVALGCPRRELKSPVYSSSSKNVPAELNHEMIITDKESDDTGLGLRSYTNMVTLNGSYLIPSYEAPVVIVEGDSCQEDGTCRKIQPNAAFRKALREGNQSIVKLLRSLIRQGVIPEKKIVQMPISHLNALSGGAARCMTWEIPSSLPECSQRNLDKFLSIKTEEVHVLTPCLAIGDNRTFCNFAHENLVALEFLEQEGSSQEMRTTDGNQLKFDRILRKRLRSALDELDAAIESSCK